MEIKTETFGTLTSKAFDKTCRYLKSVGNRLSVEFDNAVTFGVAAVYATGDATHIKVLPLLQLAKLEPMFRRTVVAFDLVPFNYDAKSCQFTGKIKPGLRAAMESHRNGVPQWETVLLAALAGEKPENKSKQAYNLENRANSFVKQAVKEGHTMTEINRALATARRANPEDSTMATPADQKLIAENSERHDAKVEVAKAA
jgi:hypothetical protein